MLLVTGIETWWNCLLGEREIQKEIQRQRRERQKDRYRFIRRRFCCTITKVLCVVHVTFWCGCILLYLPIPVPGLKGLLSPASVSVLWKKKKIIIQPVSVWLYHKFPLLVFYRFKQATWPILPQKRYSACDMTIGGPRAFSQRGQQITANNSRIYHRY